VFGTDAIFPNVFDPHLVESMDPRVPAHTEGQT
jgi:hypothetical protein